MHDRNWYVVDALMADLTSRRFRVSATSQQDAERKMQDRCPAVAAILVLEDSAALRPAAFERGWKWSQPLRSRTEPGWVWSERVNPRVHGPRDQEDEHHC
jgi:hypothetical protein